MKRIITALVIVLACSSCSLSQMNRYWSWVPVVGQERADQAVAQYEATKVDATAGRPCAEWYDHAMDAGFTPEQWKEPVSRIMYRESHCNPGADNPSSTARGLMQELRMWADDCGGVYTDLYDPTFNLNCAFHIYQVQGWNAWSTY